MKNLKKVCALVLSLAMIVSSFTMSFAAEDTMTDADKCAALGMLKGDGDEGVTEEYLAKSTTRFQAALMFLRLQDLEDEALAFEGTENFEDAEDLQWVVGRNALAYLKANPELGWVGFEGKINPNRVVTAQEYYKVMLEALGYEYGEEGDFTWDAVLTFAEEKGLKVASEVENFTNNDIAAVTVETLNAENSEGVKLIDALIEKGAIDEAKAVEVGLKESVATDATVKSAVALNSKVIQVTLTEAAEAVSASQFAVVDKDAAPIEIADAELAPWDTDNKTVLVTLATETKSGNLYSITTGETKVNFGGRGQDTKEPKLSKAEPSDYNEFILNFSEPVKIDGLKVEASEKYGDKATLEVVGVEYVDGQTVKVMTSDQKSLLYGVKVSGAVDLAGNEMKEDDTKTFVGTVKPTDPQKVAAAKAIDYNQVYVEFKTNIDSDSLADATFKITEAYGDKSEVAVLEANQATDVQAVEYKPSLTAKKDIATAVKVGVVLTVDGTMKDHLYKVVVDGVNTLYGKSMSSTTSDKETTFVGEVKPTGSFAYDSIEVTSATSINVKYARKIEKDLAEDIANYTIVEAYNSSKKDLEVLTAELKDDQKTVKITVAEMKDCLYKLTTTNLVDIYGNTQKTGADADKTFVGEAKEAKISEITSITRPNGSETEIKVTFNKKVGDNATDVALYTISGNVGYPEAVKTVDTDANSVIITLAKTTETVSYTLTVKGLNNADGIAMDADGVKGTFTGKGIAKGLPVVQAVMATDKQTAKIYFDRDVKDSTILNKVWKKDINGDMILDNTYFEYKKNDSSTSYLTLEGMAYQDPKDKNALVIVSDANSTQWAPGNGYTTYTLRIKAGVENKYVRFDENVSNLVVVPKSDEYSHPTVVGAQGINSKNLKVYFSQPVAFAKAGITSIVKNDGTNTTIAVSDISKVTVVEDSNNMEFIISLNNNKSMVSGSYTLNLNTSVTDKYVTSKTLSLDSTKPDLNSNGYVDKEFAAIGTNDNYITGVYARMMDNRTIEVVYPEAMSTREDNTMSNSYVDSNNSYDILQLDGTALSSAVNVVYVEYDKNRAVLHLDKAVPTSYSTFGIKVNPAVEDKTGTKKVSKSSSKSEALIIETANKEDANKGPAIANVAVSGDRLTLGITLNETAGLGDSIAIALDTDDTLAFNELPNIETSNPYNVPKADFYKVFTINTTLVGGSRANLTANDISSITFDGKEFTITLVKAIAPGVEGTVTTKTNFSSDLTHPEFALYNYAKVMRSHVAEESKVVFAAPQSDTFDHTAPSVITYSPVNGAAAVAVASNLVLTFSEDVNAVSGKNVVIKDVTDPLSPIDVETISVSDVTVNGNVVTINPTNDLAVDKKYTVEVEAGAFADRSSYANPTAIINNWNFNTAADVAGPTATISNNTNVATDASLEILFNEDVTIGIGNIVISNGEDVDKTIDITTLSVTDGCKVILAPQSYTLEKDYTLTIPANGFVDKSLNQNNNAEMVLNFSTKDTIDPTFTLTKTADAPAFVSTEALYKDGSALSLNQDIKDCFVYTEADGSDAIMTVTYKEGNTILFGLTNQADGDKISLKEGVTLKDAAGNALVINEITLTNKNPNPSEWE